MPSVASTQGMVGEQAMPSRVTLLAMVILSRAMTSDWSTESLIFWLLIARAVAAAGKRDLGSSSSASSGINYEVFLSFRGANTRKGLADHLYCKLVDAGIEVFKDDEKLRAGEEINQGLKDAIKRSKISIAVFSKDYASSKSCLMELVQMWECRISNGQTIIPIFYDVSPYIVKHQAGDFATSFKEHEDDDKVDSNAIKTWKKVLQQVAELVGFERENINGGHESQLVKKVCRRVRRVLKKDDRDVTKNLVGIDHHVETMMRKLGVVYSHGQAMEVCGSEVRVVGICGMPGVGKTTLAKVVFNKIHKLFDECSFLEGINSRKVELSQEKLIADLQKETCATPKSPGDGIKEIEKLFSNMKVLIVLDDAQKDEQIKALAGKLTWFGSGSRIIVTTDTKDVLKEFSGGAVEAHNLAPMTHDRALQLFRKHAFQGGKHAFQGDASEDDFEYDSVSIDIVRALGGLPLAIELWASKLRKNKKIKIWRETVDFLKANQGDEVEAAFKASYGSLHKGAQEIFLDIACFFIGKDERIPSYMWEACRYYPCGGIEELRNMHLLEVGENNELRMHNLLRDFGRKLVEEKDFDKRCRFWNHCDALKILKYPWTCQGIGNVEGIGLAVKQGSTICFPSEEFPQMSKLRYLRLDRAKIQGNTEILLPNLRWLDWRDCRSIPDLCNMHLEELVILDLSGSPVKSQIWSRFKEKLKVLNLQGCPRLVALLDFSAPINVEMLILEDCTWLSEIGPFIGQLESLSSLNLRKCSLVKQLPPQLGRMKSLRELLIDGTGIKEIQIESDSLKELEKISACDCEHLKNISSLGHLTKLTSLALDGAKINWDPDPETFKFPLKLRRLSLRDCRMITELPSSIGELGLLEVMDLSRTEITELPQSVRDLRNLKTLKMERTRLEQFPEDIVNLGKLEEIDFSGCRSLRGQVDCDISGLCSLRILRLSSSAVAGLPQSISHLTHLQTLDILNCNQLQALPMLPSSLPSLRWGTNGMRVSDLSYLTNLKELLLKDVKQPVGGLLNLKTAETLDIGWITRLTSLETLELSVSTVTNLPGNFSALTQLWELSLSYMKELDLSQLPSSNLLTLRLKHCKIAEPKFSSLIYLSELELDHCHLATIDVLKDLKLLEVLKIFGRSSRTNFNVLKELRRLRKVQLFPSDPASLSELSECKFELDASDKVD